MTSLGTFIACLPAWCGVIRPVSIATVWSGVVTQEVEVIWDGSSSWAVEGLSVEHIVTILILPWLRPIGTTFVAAVVIGQVVTLVLAS